jgi:hypothetical protein
VRNSHIVEGIEKAGFFDASIWEEAKNQDPESLKRLIDAELKYTTVTAVLIGTNTWWRRWVRYEIMKSATRGNLLVGIHINNIRDRYQQVKPLGPSPFDNVGYWFSADGMIANPIEWKNQRWVWYTDIGQQRLTEVQPESERSKVVPMSKWARLYDWALHDGYSNFYKWIQ